MKRKVLPGSQFPTDAYNQFVKQAVPRWTTTDDAIIAAYTELVDKVCPCVVLVHSQSGLFGFRVAQARPDKVKALIAVGPAAAGEMSRAGVLKNTPCSRSTAITSSRTRAGRRSARTASTS
ncbi:MAG TPA: hypothetical protein VHP37_25660 [Burkholderiales bacterium]|nr:hypothetical protein [Burkholderiales bacterium]